MNRRLLLILFVSGLMGAIVVVTMEGSTASEAHLQQTFGVQNVPLSLETIQGRAPFRVRELHGLPTGYKLATSLLRESPRGAANDTSVVLIYGGADGGLLELTQTPLRMTLAEGRIIRVGNLDVQYAEHYPPGATTRTFMWRDGDISLQLNVYVPETARANLNSAVLQALVVSAR
jgi:hypothetical protein